MKNTRQRLLDTATQMFAEYGYDGVSTRDLVCMSGVNLCTINYYFGSKQKLYDAVISDIVERVRSELVDVGMEYVNANNLTPYEHLMYSLGHFFDFLFSDSISNAMVLIAVREIMMPSGVECRIHNDVLNPLHIRVSRLVMDASGVDETTAAILAHGLFSQMCSLRLQQNVFKYDAAFVATARQQMLENCEILLRGRGQCQKNQQNLHSNHENLQ